jgi:hypothetical protein
MLPVLPSLPIGPHTRDAAAAAMVYLAAGAAFHYATGTQVTGRCADHRREDFGRPAAEVAEAVVVVLLVVLLWPTAVVLRLAGAVKRNRHRRSAPGWGSRAVGLVVRRTAVRISVPVPGRARPGTEQAEQLVCAMPEYGSGYEGGAVVAARFAAEAARVTRACEQGRLVEAVFAATALVDQVTLVYGPGHRFVLSAVELLAHVCRLVGDDARCVQLYVHAAAGRAQGCGVGDPAARAALRNAFAVWLGASDQASRRTGPLLLPYLRLFSGAGSAPVAAVAHRLRELRAADVAGPLG